MVAADALVDLLQDVLAFLSGTALGVPFNNGEILA
jgi:hypothetical protein